MGSGVPGGGGTKPAGGGTRGIIGIIGIIIPPEDTGPYSVVGSQFGLVGSVRRGTPEVPDVAGVVEALNASEERELVSAEVAKVFVLVEDTRTWLEVAEISATFEDNPMELEETAVVEKVVSGYAVSRSGPVTDGMGSPVGKRLTVPLSHVVFAVGITTGPLEAGSGELSHAQKTPQPGLGHPGP